MPRAPPPPPVEAPVSYLLHVFAGISADGSPGWLMVLALVAALSLGWYLLQRRRGPRFPRVPGGVPLLGHTLQLGGQRILSIR